MEVWDYIIVGGGSAGCVLANRLSADPSVKVLLLDAGRSDKHLFSKLPAGVPLALARNDMNWKYMAEPDPSRGGKVDMWPAGKLLGGGSAINGMMWVRGHRNDYDGWARLGNPGWSYEEVLPYFRRSESNPAGADAWRGGDGPVQLSENRSPHALNQVFIDAARQAGIAQSPDLSGEVQEGVAQVQSTQRNGLRESVARAYIDPIRHRPNLHIRQQACVTRLTLENGRATGVEFKHGDGRHVVYARHGVIVSAGAIASPKLLLLSGIGPKQELEALGIKPQHDLPGVGKNLLEHAAVRISIHVNVPTLSSDMGLISGIRHVLNYAVRRRGPLSMCIGHAQAMVRTSKELDAPNVQIIFSPLAFEFSESGVRPYPQPAVTAAVGLCHAHSSGEVRLNPNQPEAAPIIRHALLQSQHDIDDLIEGCRLTRAIFAAPAFSPYLIDERLPGATVQHRDDWEAFIRDTAFLMYHPAGTCRMGQDEMAVVGADLKVRGISGLWIADASVMPTIPAGNINATCVMIGEKASDLVFAARAIS